MSISSFFGKIGSTIKRLGLGARTIAVAGGTGIGGTCGTGGGGVTTIVEAGGVAVGFWRFLGDIRAPDE